MTTTKLVLALAAIASVAGFSSTASAQYYRHHHYWHHHYYHPHYWHHHHGYYR